MSRAKVPEGARRFQIELTIFDAADDKGDCVSAVEVSEAGAKNSTTNMLPPGIFGLREGLRIAGNQVRTMYLDKQRLLDLRERSEAVKRNREELQAERLDARKKAAAGKKGDADATPKQS